MTETRRLHPAAIAVYSAEALRSFAFPLLVVLALTLFGGELDVTDLVRSLAYGLVGLGVSIGMGLVRWQTTTYWLTADGVHHRSGVISTKVTDVPLARLEAIDVHQGPLQRAFGVQAVEIQTGAGGKGGEISLPALTPAAVAELKGMRPQAGTREVAAGPTRRLSPRALLLTALTAGQLGLILPLLAGAGQLLENLGKDNGEDAIRLLPDSLTTWGIAAGALIVAAWLLSALGSVVAFAGFTVTRDGDRLRIRRGFVSRSEASVSVTRIRAVRVVEGVFRRPFGLAALQIEVLGYAEEASASRTLFPLLRIGEVREFLDELLPELADEPRALERPPSRAARRYLLLPVLAGAAVAAAAFPFVGPLGLPALVLGALYGQARWRAAGWHLVDGRLAVRRLRLARTTILAPLRFGESRTVAQNPFQRRARLADLIVPFGKQTTAHIRHLEAADAQGVTT